MSSTEDTEARYQRTDQDREYHQPTVDLSPDKMEELDRLRAAMGFIPEEAAKPKVIGNRYRVLRQIGAGGMGVVSLAEDELLESTVAIKVIREDHLRDAPAACARLCQEARQMARLRGTPNVVDVFEFGLDRGSAYITMAYIEGPDLREWVGSGTRSVEEILTAYLGAARGLFSAHQHDIVHRDFKPENVLVDKEGQAKVTDFGIAKIDDEPLDRLRDTLPPGHSTAPRGTIPYMPPEQMDGARADGRADQFSFCIALWEALAGAHPYDWRDSSSQRSALEQTPRNERAVPLWLRPALRKGMSAERQDRFASMKELIVVLERGLERPRRRRRVFFVSTTTVLTGALGAVIGSLFLTLSAPPSTCSPYVESIQASWNSDRREQLRQRGEKFSVDTTWLIDSLDELTSTWAEQAVATCSDGQAPSPDDPQRMCLDGWIGYLDHAVDLLVERGDRDTLLRAPDLIAALTPPSNDFCGLPELPDDPTLADLVEGARTAAVAGARTEAAQLSEQALERARALAGDHEYTVGLAHAHAVRGEALMFAREFEDANEEYRLAEAQATGVDDLSTLARIRVMWAKSLSFSSEEGAVRSGNEHLDRSVPLFVAASIPDDALLRGELLETRAIIHEDLGQLAQADTEYTQAIDFFDNVGNPLLAARATNNRGTYYRDSGKLEAAASDFRRAIEAYRLEGVPSNYPRLLDAQFDLGMALYDLYFAIEDPERTREYPRQSLDLLARVADEAEPQLRLSALGQACQVAADTKQLERATELTSTARNELALAASHGIDQATIDHVDVQVTLAELRIAAPDAPPRTRALLARQDELDPSLYWALARSFVEHLERIGACDEARIETERISGLDDVDEFREWKAQRPGGACR